jgi:uncharacterized protein YbjT (DUF2867 family)
MYAVTGITGKVGGIVARTLLGAGFPVRAIVRDADKGRAWAERGCEVAIASISDEAGLSRAFSGVDGVFLMTPPDFDPEPGFPKTHEAIAATKTATSPQSLWSFFPQAVPRWLNLISLTTPR